MQKLPSMPEKLGFYELLDPYITFGLTAQSAAGTDLKDLLNAGVSLNSNFPGAVSTLSDIVTSILDYLSVEELFTTADENMIVYRGSAKFGGDGRANPELPSKQGITSANGQELRWLDDMFAFRLTVPRRSAAITFDTIGLNGADLSDLQALNTLLNAFTDTPAGAVSDQPGSDFRLELLIRSVQIALPPDDFIPARVADDGWLERDPSFDQVLFEFPKLAFVLEQQGGVGNLDLQLKSWDSAGFDDPGDVDTARFFTLTPSYFLYGSGIVGFGIDRLVADFSDNVTPPEILEQFGIGDDFNGFWLPLIQIFVAPGRTKGLAFNARGQDLLFDFDKGFSGEVGLELINRIGNELKIEPFFYANIAENSQQTFTRGQLEIQPDGTTTVGKGSVTIPGNGEMQLFVRGTDPPYLIEVKLAGQLLPPDTSNGNQRPKWRLNADQSGLLEIKVSDNGNKNRWEESLEVKHTAAPVLLEPIHRQYEFEFFPNEQNEQYSIHLLKTISDKKVAEFGLTHHTLNPEFIVDGETVTKGDDGIYRAFITEILLSDTIGAPVRATWEAKSIPPLIQAIADENKVLSEAEQIQLITDTSLQGVFRFYFKKGYPYAPSRAPAAIVDDLNGVGVEGFLNYLNTSPIKDDEFNSIKSPDEILEDLKDFLEHNEGEIRVFGFASHESEKPFDNDTILSDIRKKTLELLIDRSLQSLPITRVVKVNSHTYSHTADSVDLTKDSDERFRVAIAVFVPAAEPVDGPITLTGRVTIRDISDIEAPPEIEHPPTPTEPDTPSIFRRLGIRFRFERNFPVLGEISGQLDFNTATEDTLNFVKANDDRNQDAPNSILPVTTSPGASADGEQGILDYRLTIDYDRATRRLTQELALGFDQKNRDGWVNITSDNPGIVANTLGSLLVFAPLLNSGIDSAVNRDGEEATRDIIVAGAEVIVATTLGLTGAIKFHKWTLFGIELSATELLADNQAQQSTRFGQLSVLFDYAVDFTVNINLLVLTIRTKEDDDGKPIPIKVRYRGLGFRLNANTDDTYEPVFDTSKGFDLGIAEPGALEIGGPLGPILKVLSVRVARENPLVLELDLGMHANLGVISVESVRVRIPVQPPGIPTIIPTAIGVNIPGVLVGKGYLNLHDNGFTGAIDVTLVPMKLRIQASVGVESLEVANRRITAFFMSLGVEFPTPLPLGGTGLGLYGLLGLFGMHYKRDETPPVNPNLQPALDWFYNKAKGEPHELAVDGRPTWIAAPDRWSFGLGVVLGTMEGAFILNLKGMLVLELPGPRILIFVKAQILVPRPPSGKPADQTAGILAVVDLNFQVGYIAIGLLFSYEVKELIRLEIPIDSSFSFNDIEDWHLYAGSLSNKASADILGIAKGTAYLMFDGKGIPSFPLGALEGFSIAAGIAASLVIGDKDSGLYAEVSGAMDVGVSTAPFHFLGQLKLEGSIHLWIMSIGASAKFTVEAPDPLYVYGEVCGSIDLWLTELEGCVEFKIGEEPSLPDPEPLLTGLSLQSHSPALVEGQATDQPVDSSLGVLHTENDIINNVPIDVIPVLQMKYPPVFSNTVTELRPLNSAPTLAPESDGWVSLGGIPGSAGEREVRYEVKSISISPELPDGNTDIPVTWWQPTRPDVPADSQATDKAVNLALNSWIPVPFPRAYQRSNEQRQVIRERFEVICRDIAPPVSVLWTFNDQLSGPSTKGWLLDGVLWPDPPGTHRSSFPERKLSVHEPAYPFRDHQLINELATKVTGQVYDPSRVIPAVDLFPLETDTPPEEFNGKALRFPFLQFSESLINNSLTNDMKELVNKFLSEAGARERIVVEIKQAAEVRILLSYHQKMKVNEFTFYQAFDDQDQIVEEGKITGYPITGFSTLPPRWQESGGPWRKEVEPVYRFLAGTFKGSHGLFLFEWKPKENVTRVEIIYRNPVPSRPFTSPPPLLLGVVEILPQSEKKREIAAIDYQSDMTEVVVNALQEGDQRPLFAPNMLYTVSVNYEATIRKKANPSTKNTLPNQTQSFQFRTSPVPPARLAPWVLATSPVHDEDSHFTEDPIQIIFNDAAIIQLFRAYEDRKLKAVLRKANGNHPPEQPVADGPALRPIPTVLRTPFAKTMLEVIEEMPCIPEIIETERHLVFTVDVELERGTAYTLDIEADPESIQPDNLVPLFRTAFTTSRFESALELGELLLLRSIEERVTVNPLILPLKRRQLVVPDDDAPSHTATLDIAMVSNAEMETALLDALGSDLPPSQQPNITFLWSHEQPAKPLAFLIDAPESLLRTHLVPVEVVTPTPDDDAIQHFRNEEQLWLEIVETDNNTIDQIVYTTGGCRAIILLKDNAAGSMIKLALRQYRHALMIEQVLQQDFPILEASIPAKASWEF